VFLFFAKKTVFWGEIFQFWVHILGRKFNFLIPDIFLTFCLKFHITVPHLEKR